MKNLSKEEMKKVIGGVAAGGAGCYRVYSDQGGSSCWYSASGDAVDLCDRVYGEHCNGTSMGSIDCSSNNCTMN